MFVDARTLRDGMRLDADVCVIGAGAAGITIARELAGSTLRVCVLESGDFAPEAATQALYAGQNAGVPYYELDALRLRYFGGTTNHWAGVSRPLEPMDFEPRSWVPRSGWPFTLAHLEPFYRRAHEICELGAYDYDAAAIEQAATCLRLDPERLWTAIYRRSRPTRFGPTYRDQLDRAANVDVYLNANAVELVTVESGRALDRVRVRTLTGVELDVHARALVLATGAIENARLLLASNTQQRAGLGNGNDVVGRYFMEHVRAPSALLLPAAPASVPPFYPADAPLRGGTNMGRAFLAFPPETLEREQMLNLRAGFDPAYGLEALRGTSEAVESVYSLMRSVTGDFATHDVGNIARNPDDVLMYAYRRLFRPPRIQAYWIINQVEHAPNPDSRVQLIAERDALGTPRAQLAWRLTGLERATVRRSVRLLAEELGRAGIGRVQALVEDPQSGWPSVHDGLRGAWHQMGTTRMHRDPRYGVVDEHCCVHGIDNLYVAGSSVFPTSGYTNPTLTIVALAIRMADRLKGALR